MIQKDWMETMSTQAWAHGRTEKRKRRELRRLEELSAKVLDLQTENQRLRQLAHIDELTGLGNRRQFKENLQQALAHSIRYGQPLSLVMLDVDGFKQLNDAHGHPAGDEALRRIGELLRGSIRPMDQTSRLGGDEFAIVLPATRTEEATRVADRVREQVNSMLLPKGHHLSISAGVSCTTTPYDPRAVEQLVTAADQALYSAKRSGKNRVTLSEPIRLSEAS